MACAVWLPRCVSPLGDVYSVRTRCRQETRDTVSLTHKAFQAGLLRQRNLLCLHSGSLWVSPSLQRCPEPALCLGTLQCLQPTGDPLSGFLLRPLSSREAGDTPEAPSLVPNYLTPADTSSLSQARPPLFSPAALTSSSFLGFPSSSVALFSGL